MKVYMVLYLNIGIIMSQNLFFSEYIEGSSYNKALEIFNYTDTEIELSGYEIWKVTNSEGDWTDNNGEGSYALNLGGSVIPPNDVLVICRTSFDIDNQSKCDLMNYATLNFNGDDAIGLAYNGTLIDIIGTLGGDPGSGFDVAGTSNATKDHTLIRKESVQSGNIDWSTSAGTNSNNSEWIILDKDYFTNLGSHTCSACGESTICNDSSACNFGDEGECNYILENDCDCDSNILDCNDVCGGSAVIDECGVCNGLGAVYDCGCEGLPDGTCDCDGNELDVCGDCGGGIIDSVNCNLEFKTVRPQNYKMINAYPNPFNSNTTITLHNMGNTFVKLDIIDLNGHIIDSIYSGYLYEKSTHTFLWDASENNSGIYIARISQNKNIITHKIILLK